MQRTQPRRYHLLRTALGLYNDHGFHNVGVDLVSQQSGVSKTTLYKYYKSKDELILGALELRNDQFLQYINNCIEQSKRSSPELAEYQHIYAIFEAFKQWTLADDFSGCNFVNASAEYYGADNPIFLYAAEHKEKTEKIIIKLLCELPEAEASLLGKQIMILLEGAVVNAQVRMDKTSIDLAKTVLTTLLNQSFA